MSTEPFLFYKSEEGQLMPSERQPLRVVQEEQNDLETLEEMEFEKRTRVGKRQRVEIKNDDYEQLMMLGVPVRFPRGVNPYSTQKLMIVRILAALKNSENVLGESPTGSGKTMALLSSTCAWLKQYIDERKASEEKCPIHRILPVRFDEYGNRMEDVKLKIEEKKKENILEEQCRDDFISHNPEISIENEPEVKQEEPPAPPECTCLPRVRIYYGTRTHKQITQVVKEFSRLPYANIIKHTILASREQSCINPKAREKPDISKYCKEILAAKEIGCSFKANMRSRFDKAAALRDHLQDNGSVIFDIEQVVETLNESYPQICPYFSTNRVLTQDADLIFCPFSYLVDPLIRSASDVHIKDSVVILDEAHNIEDTCREAASFSFTEKELVDTVLSFRGKGTAIDEKLLKRNEEFESTNQLKELRGHLMYLENLVLEIIQWVRQVSEESRAAQKGGQEGRKTCTLSAEDLFSSLTNEVDLFTPPKTPRHDAIAASFDAITEYNEQEKDLNQWKPSTTAVAVIQKWLYFQSYFGNPQYQSTYRLNLSIESINEWKDPTKSQTEHEPISVGCKTTISLWCMSPAISFVDAFSETRTIILASGTLCPMDTLKTELGMEFKQQVEGDQVISPDNIFAAVLPIGPHGNRITCTYKNTSDPESPFYQEVGSIVKYVCSNVPAGILCFVPSYRVLEQLTTVMYRNKSLEQIKAKKLILYEPRRSSELPQVMAVFDEAIFNPTKFGPTTNGALMFAVFRGKVSEGIDFADDRARVVISVGIPFPNAMDDQVNAKKLYNDQNSKEMGILTGDEWYTTQAYRALNQALGRCLRHRNDWGAMLLIDDRLERQARPMTGTSSARVSKWIRAQMKSYPSFQLFNDQFRQFIERRLTKQEKN